LLIIVITFYINANSQNPTFTWVRGMGGSATDLGNAVKTDASGNVYSVGNFNDAVDFDPGPGSYSLTPVGNTDAFISKLDASGNFVWAKSIGGTSFDVAYSICVQKKHCMFFIVKLKQEKNTLKLLRLFIMSVFNVAF